MSSRALKTYAAWVVRHRFAALFAVLLATVFLARATTRLHVEVDPDRQLPQDHPFIRTLNDVHRIFGDKNLVVIGLFPHDGNVFTPAFLKKLAEVTDAVRRLPGANPALVQSLAAPQVKDIRGTEDGMEVERVMETPPTDMAGAEDVRQRAFSNEAYVGTLVAADGSAAAVQASFELTPETPGYRHLHAAVLAALRAADDGTFDYSLSGPVVFLSQLSTYANRMIYFFPLALVVIGVVHYHAFRTLQALFLPLVTALLSVLWAVGLMGLLGVQFDPYNTTTPILILAVAAGHPVPVPQRFYQEFERSGDAGEAIVASLGRVGPVMIAAGTIAALSFCSLATFQTATIRTFGLFTGFGIASALVIELTIIPAVRALLPAPRGREREREAAAHPWLDRMLAVAHRTSSKTGAGSVFAAAGVLVVLCGVLATRITVDTSYKREFGAREPIRVEDAKINARFAGTNTLVLLIEGDGQGTLEEPPIMRAIYALERRLEGEPGVGKALSYVDFVRQMHLALTADRADQGELPGTRPLTAQYLFLYSLSGGAEDFDTLIDPDHRVAKVRLLIHQDSTYFGQHLIAVAQDVVAKTFPAGYRVRYTGSLASTAAATEVMVHGKLRNILQIALITLCIAALLLRSVTAGLLVATPLALTVAVNFGVMGLLGIPLDTVTSMISAMAVGIGADYAVYFLFRLREELAGGADLDEALGRTLRTSGKAVLIVSSASALILLPAIVARFRPAFLWSSAVAVAELEEETAQVGEEWVEAEAAVV